MTLSTTFYYSNLNRLRQGKDKRKDSKLPLLYLQCGLGQNISIYITWLESAWVKILWLCKRGKDRLIYNNVCYFLARSPGLGNPGRVFQCLKSSRATIQSLCHFFSFYLFNLFESQRIWEKGKSLTCRLITKSTPFSHLLQQPKLSKARAGIQELSQGLPCA